MIYKQTRNYENQNKAMFDGVGQYDIPEIRATQTVADEFIGFNYVKSSHNVRDKGVHFFVDDYQFTRLWANPDAYTMSLKRFKSVCTPDFSTYTDFPKALQIYNHFRKHWLGAYWQAQGIDVVPTISWSDESSYEWCFDGEPHGGTVAISSVGTQQNREASRLFLKGYAEMLTRLQPTAVLFYGAVPAEIANDARIIRLGAFQEQMKKRIQDAQKKRGKQYIAG